MVDDIPKKSRTGGEIKEIIALRVAFLVGFSQCLSYPSVESRVLKFAAYIENPLDHPIMKLRINGAGGELVEIVAHDLLILFAAVIVAADADDREVSREQLALDQVID